MTTVQAWQHIYSNVEKEQSPKGRGGFQTLFYTTAGLTADEVSEMEGRLLYFPAKTAEPVKRVFFTTTSGKAVIAQIVVLPEPDQIGRKGRYLAHALAFTPADLAKFEADPFRVFRSFSFLTTVKEALAHGDFKSGNIPAVTLTVSPKQAQDVQAAQQWSIPELKKLALLALRVEEQTQAREAITVSGEPAEIERTLEAAFLAVPVSLRPRCMFDTYFYRCNLVATFYWAIGLLEPPVGIKFVLVDGPARTVRGAAPTQAKTAYEHWILTMLEGKKLGEIANQRDYAFALGEWLDGRDYETAHLETSSPALITEMFTINPVAVQSFLRRRVGEHFPESLVDRTATYIYQQTKPTNLYQKLRQGFVIETLVGILYGSYEAEKFVEPPRDEVKALEQVLAQLDHRLLRLFTAYWRGARRFLPEALAAASEADYKEFVNLALRWNLVKPLNLLVTTRANAFLDAYLAAGVEDWVELVEAIIEVKAMPSLSRLSPSLAKLSRNDLEGLDRLAAEQKETPADFRVALGKAMAALPPEGGIKGFLKAALNRLPGLGSE